MTNIDDYDYILNNISNNDFDMIINNNINNIKTTKNSRKRQDSMNKASKKCRDRKKELFKLMEEHIEELHSLITNNNLDNSINVINKYKEKIKIIKDK